MGKALSPLVRLCINRHCSQANPAVPYIKQSAILTYKLYFRPIQRLLAIAVGPPTFRVVDSDDVPFMFFRRFLRN